MKKYLTALGIVVAFLPNQRTSAQVLIFDNSPSTSDAFGRGDNMTFGDLVTAGGTDRNVSSFSTQIDAPAGFSADVSLRFYNPAASETVGTQIGSTATQNSVSFASGLNTISFTGLNLTVPDNFIWSITLANTSGNAYFAQTGSSPSIGSTESDLAYTSLTTSLAPGQSQSSFVSPGGNLTATITAAPEPAAYGLAFGLAALGLGVCLRRKRQIAG